MNIPFHDPGGKVRLALKDGIVGDAELSPCGKYRHWLSRRWQPPAHIRDGDGYALWIGMNPSTADASVDDPTVSREIQFTRAMGLSYYVKCNIMDYRATLSRELLKPGTKPCSDRNIDVIRVFARDARKIILCYGVIHRELEYAANLCVEMLRREGHELWCLGKTLHKNHPRHPLYLRSDVKLVRF